MAREKGEKLKRPHGDSTFAEVEGMLFNALLEIRKMRGFFEKRPDMRVMLMAGNLKRATEKALAESRQIVRDYEKESDEGRLMTQKQAEEWLAKEAKTKKRQK